MEDCPSFFSFLLITSCSILSKNSRNKSKVISLIPLEVFSKENGFHANIEILVDGHLTKVLLDTGAPSSRIQSDEFTSKYPVIDKKESKGVSGKGITLDVIQPKTVTIGDYIIQTPRLRRGEDSGVIGLDLFENLIFQYDLDNKVMKFLNTLPPERHQVKRLQNGHLAIPIKIGDDSVYALFDTGSDATVIDSKYIRDNSKIFKLLGQEDGTDHHGHKVESKIYTCSSIQAATLTLKNVEIAAFEFPDFLREKMEGIPIILGNNVLVKGKWSFDLKAGLWTLDPHHFPSSIQH